MSWRFIDDNHIGHSDGHTIQLKQGRWENPGDLEPVFAQNLKPLDAVSLLREGLAFAKTKTPQVKKNNFLRSRAATKKQVTEVGEFSLGQNNADLNYREPSKSNKKAVKIIVKKRPRLTLNKP